jgi:hypothetical protein
MEHIVATSQSRDISDVVCCRVVEVEGALDTGLGLWGCRPAQCHGTGFLLGSYWRLHAAPRCEPESTIKVYVLYGRQGNHLE